MLNDLGALTLLGESADWLKGADGASIRDHRLAVLDAFHHAWQSPCNPATHEALRAAMVPLFQALRHNHLYPDEHIFGKPEDGAAAYLVNPKNLRKDIEQIQSLCATNKFGVGEIHLLYHTFLLYRSIHSMDIPYDRVAEKKLADILFLREPVFRADNIGVFSTELLARFHAVRILRNMQALGLLDDNPVSEISQAEQSEARELLADELRKPATEYILKPHHRPFAIFDTASSLESYARSHAASCAPVDERGPEELFLRLRHHVRRIETSEDIGPKRAQRLTNLAVAAIVRAMAHLDLSLGQKLYTFLRSKQHKARVRHSRMFQFLPNAQERLRFLNFLLGHGQQNPVYYVERFQGSFPEHKLRFVNKASGFVLDPK